MTAEFFSAWENTTLDFDEDLYELSRIAAYEYPASERARKIYTFMLETGFPNSTEQGIDWIRNPMYKEGQGKYDLLGESPS